MVDLDFKAAEARSRPLLIVFDFDGTLIEENSDLVPFKELSYGKSLGPRFITLRKEQGMGWTQIMQTQLAELATREGYSKADLSSCIRDVKIDPTLRRALKTLKHCQDPQTKLAIASDANTVFIEEILDANDIESGTFASIYTNSGTWSANDVLDVQPYQPLAIPHGCPRACPPNMCKTTILERALRDIELGNVEDLRTIYVGDGGNDFCPSLSLKATDLVLVREGLALHKLIDKASVDESSDDATTGSHENPATSDHAQSFPPGAVQVPDSSQLSQKVVAEVKIWKTHEQLGQLLLELIGEVPAAIKKPLPTAPDDSISSTVERVAQLNLEKGSHI
jgi:pyridoxal phosphate phosphatase PHOSPHO2